MNMKTLVDALPSIRKIAGQELSMKTLYRVKRLLDKLEAHLRIYDEQRTKIMERCCTVEDGKYVPKPDMAETLEADMRELLDVEIDPGDPAARGGGSASVLRRSLCVGRTCGNRI